MEGGGAAARGGSDEREEGSGTAGARGGGRAHGVAPASAREGGRARGGRRHEGEERAWRYVVASKTISGRRDPHGGEKMWEP